MEEDRQAAEKKHGVSPAPSLLWTRTQCRGSEFHSFPVRVTVIADHLLIEQWQLLTTGACYGQDEAHNHQIILPVFLLPCSSKAVKFWLHHTTPSDLCSFR